MVAWFVDSFFHVEQAAAWGAVGIPLYGLDFRRSGRALRVANRRDDLRDLLIREEEIFVALNHLRSVGAKQIVLIGHSTGGLQAALFADRHPGAVDAVILNSPWLEHNGPMWQKTVATSAIMQLARWLLRSRWHVCGVIMRVVCILILVANSRLTRLINR